ncbi:MAG TPA: MBL fold metallo-hydrolase [Polyangia bacterium]|nr:MBL fold metallo-hydrolase [Polyangia bacterium]
MKRLHRRDLFGWSWFYEPLNIDFNSVAWIRDGGNVIVDPLPLSAHDRAHLEKLGGAAWVIVTNSDHVRATRELVAAFGARVAGPAAERDAFPLACDRWLADGDELAPGLAAFALDGSKTPGELALVLDGTTLITGDLVRAHRAGALMMLSPEQKLKDAARARGSIARLAALPIEAVLVGDGWPLFADGARHLANLTA